MQLYELSVRELSEKLQRRDITCTELVSALHARADDVNPKINALVHQFRERSLAQAHAADQARGRGDRLGPLHGIPFTVKESVDTAGTASTMGIEGRVGRPASEDAVVVQVARQAGAILLGKTNIPQTLLSPAETTNYLWGTTHNPWNLGRSPGGSTGGESAAIAAGLSPWGIGSDIGGSIRIPAAFTGICGLKPTALRWSNVGSTTMIPGQEMVRAQVGPMARTTADLALLFQAMDGPANHLLDARVPPLTIGDPLSLDVSTMRIGFYEDDGFFRPAASCRRAVRMAVEALADAGAEVVEYTPLRAEEAIYLYLAALSSDGGVTANEKLGSEAIIPQLRPMRRVARMPTAARLALSKSVRMLGDKRLARMLEVFGRKAVEDLWDMTAKRTLLQREELQTWTQRGLDAVIGPAHVTPAMPHNTSHDFVLAFCYTARYNLLDMPAGVLPVTRVRFEETRREHVRDRLDRRAAQIEARSKGLPVGVQVVSRPWQENIVLAVMHRIEEHVRDKAEFPRTPVTP